MKKGLFYLLVILAIVSGCSKKECTPPPPQRDTLKDSLVAWYKLNGDATDASGNNHHGTINGNPFADKDRHGNSGGSLSFDGLDDFINAGNFITGLDSMTLSLWINIGGYSSSNRSYMTPIAQNSPQGPPFNSFPFAFYTDQGPKATGFLGYWNANPVTTFDLRTDGNLGTGFWHHLLVTFDGKNLKQYINSSNDNSIQVTPGKKIGNTYPLLIGKGYAYPQGDPLVTSFFKGQIDDIRIYKRVLTNSEIGQLFSE